MVMGEKDNERRDEGTDPVLNLTDVRSAAEGVEVERKKPPVGNNNFFFVGDSTRCRALDTAQGAGAGLFFLTGTIITLQAEFRLETRPNSSDSSVKVFYGLRGEGVVREREIRLMRGTG